MKLIRLSFLTILFFSYLLLLASSVFAQEFKYQVQQEKLLKDSSGELIISTDQIEFRAEKNSLKWRYEDIELIQLDSPTEIKIWSYSDQTWMLGKDKRFTFQVIAPLVDKVLIAFLRNRLERPYVISFAEDKENVIAEIQVKHSHRMGGCQGVLKIYSEQLMFVTPNGQDSRSWHWKEIKSINRTDKWNLEIFTYENMMGGPKRSYQFKLKEPLSEKLYDQLWNNIYQNDLTEKD